MTDMGAPVDAVVGGESGGEAPVTGASDTSTESTPGINPAWNSVLDKLPPEFHSQIIPTFQEWDKNFQSKTSEVQSQYEPYNFLLENGVDPQRVQMALNLTNIIDADPRKFYDEMGNFYKDQWGQGQQGQEEEFQLSDAEEDFDITKHPKFQELQQTIEAMSQGMQQKEQENLVKQAEAEVEQEVTQLKEKYGDWDEEFVFSLAVAKNLPLEDAVKAYQAKFGATQTQPKAPAPTIFPTTNNSVPLAQQVDPAKMNRQQTRQMVVDILKAQSKE